MPASRWILKMGSPRAYASAATLQSSSHSRFFSCQASRAAPSKRFNAPIAWVSAGDFITPGRPTIIPQRFGTTCQSSFTLGSTTARAPITLLTAVITATAGKSGGHCIRCAISITQPRRAWGKSSESNASTGGRSSGKGVGSGHAEPSLPAAVSLNLFSYPAIPSKFGLVLPLPRALSKVARTSERAKPAATAARSSACDTWPQSNRPAAARRARRPRSGGAPARCSAD